MYGIQHPGIKILTLYILNFYWKKMQLCIWVFDLYTKKKFVLIDVMQRTQEYIW